ncbi:MAG TPA: putative glycolipid-binding domain-containing protein [Agromyces sp.]
MSQTVYWRRTDVIGLERLELARGADGIEASGTVLCLEDGGFELAHRWRLSPEWQAQSVEVERRDAGGAVRLAVERQGDGWLVDGVRRSDLDGAEEPDLSVTPLCNAFPIRRLAAPAASVRELDVCFIDADTMSVTRARQRYERIDVHRVRYVSIDGASAGFTAELVVDDDGLVRTYEHLFERVEPTGPAGGG